MPIPEGPYKSSPPWGHVAEWLRNGLQNRVHQFNSGRGLHEINDLDARLVSHQIFESIPQPRWRLASGGIGRGADRRFWRSGRRRPFCREVGSSMVAECATSPNGHLATSQRKRSATTCAWSKSVLGSSIANSSPPIRASTSLVLLHSRARLATCTIARSRPSLRLETSQRQFEKPDRFMQIALGCSCAKTRRQKDELQLRHASQSEAEWRLGCSSSFAYEGRRRVRIVSKMIS